MILDWSSVSLDLRDCISFCSAVIVALVELVEEVRCVRTSAMERCKLVFVVLMLSESSFLALLSSDLVLAMRLWSSLSLVASWEDLSSRAWAF